MIKIVLFLLLTVLSSLAYRIGGMGREDSAEPKFIPKWLRNSKVRDIGCSIISLVTMLILGIHANIMTHLVSFLLLWAALSTYWDDLFNGIDNFYMAGLGCALAYLPYAIFCGLWLPLLFRCFTLSMLWGIWSGMADKDTDEEFGRGALLQITLLFYLI